MYQVAEHHLQAPDLPSHEHGRKQILRDAPRYLAPSNDTKESPSVSLLMLPHLHPSEIRAEYHIPNS